MSDEERTAQVIVGPAPGTPPDPAHVDTVVGWFRDRGFGTGPFVGTSFAITGGDDLFRDTFGDVPTADDGAEAELPLGLLGNEVAPHVAAVVVTGPPDFGPGNP